MWDEMVIYIAEMCKDLEIIELNSELISDAAISHLLKRTNNLKALDISGLTQFTGMAFGDIYSAEQFAPRETLRWL